MKTFVPTVIFGLSSLLLPMTQSAAAQSELIDWYKVASGGGTSTGATYSVTGTIGQTDAGQPLGGGTYSLTGGFWSLLLVVESTISPTLFVEYSNGNVLIHWQAQNGWVLQENVGVSGPSGWTNSVGLLTVNGESFHNVASLNGALFFRLKRN